MFRIVLRLHKVRLVKVGLVLLCLKPYIYIHIYIYIHCYYCSYSSYLCIPYTWYERTRTAYAYEESFPSRETTLFYNTGVFVSYFPTIIGVGVYACVFMFVRIIVIYIYIYISQLPVLPPMFVFRSSHCFSR